MDGEWFQQLGASLVKACFLSESEESETRKKVGRM